MLVFLLIVIPVSRGNAEKMELTQNSRGAIQMKTHPLGRFSIGIPMDMKQAGRSHRLRLAKIQEIAWHRNNNHEIRSKLWDTRVAEIKKMRPPQNKKGPIIELREFSALGQWAKGIFYYGNYALEKEGKWEVLIDFGSCGIWLETDSTLIGKENVDKTIRNLTNIAKAYTARTDDDPDKFGFGDWFHLENGAINLPYRWEEQTYARFEGHPLNLKLELEMSETHTDEPKDEGLLARTAAVIATGYAAGVDIDRLRSRKRKAAGLDGEEEVDRMTDRHRAAISFGWRYAGKKDSGEYPEMVIRMESPDGNLEEKLKIWDAILDSMKPLYKNN